MSALAQHPIAADGVRAEARSWGFVYRGRREALVACGLVGPGQLPGAPGQRKSVVRFEDRQGRRVQVYPSGRHSLRVHVCRTLEETRAAQAGHPGAADPARALREARAQAMAGAQLEVGSRALAWFPGAAGHGEYVEILQPFDFYQVMDEEGPEVNGQGERYCFAWGYVARTPRGERAFFRAHQLRGLDLRVAHLRRVV
jgi:hypothetical protein